MEKKIIYFHFRTNMQTHSDDTNIILKHKFELYKFEDLSREVDDSVYLIGKTYRIIN